MPLKYKRVLLKLSGESLMSGESFGISADMLVHYATLIKEVQQAGVEVAVVIGGGNIFRGLQAKSSGIERVQGDYMGMLATVINGMALQSALEQQGVFTRLITAIKMEKIAEPYIRRRAIRHVENVILKGTRVDGIYSADPEKDPTAEKFDKLKFAEVISAGYSVMDMTAFTMCQESNLPIIVFDINRRDNLMRIINGEAVGTLVEG